MRIIRAEKTLKGANVEYIGVNEGDKSKYLTKKEILKSNELFLCVIDFYKQKIENMLEIEEGEAD